MATTGEKIRRIFDEYGIEYIFEGANVKQGNFNVRCPYCGDADPSHHMGITEDSGIYGCWRSTEHRGRNPIRLIRALTGAPVSVIRSLLYGIDAGSLSIDFDKVIDGSVFKKESLVTLSESSVNELDLSRYRFRKIKAIGVTVSFFRYLQNSRGFGSTKITKKMIDRYGLLCALSGKYKRRIVIPISMDNRIVSFTTRSMYKNTTIKYLSLGNSEGVLPIKETVYNFDNCKNASDEILIITEGPFDALKLDYYGHKFGVHAIALYGMAATQAQKELIYELSECYDRIIVILDIDMFGEAMKLAQTLLLASGKTAEVLQVPEGRKDFGETSSQQIKKFCKALKEDL